MTERTLLEKSVLCPIMTTTKEVVEVMDIATETKTKGGSEVVGAAAAWGHSSRSAPF